MLIVSIVKFFIRVRKEKKIESERERKYNCSLSRNHGKTNMKNDLEISSWMKNLKKKAQSTFIFFFSCQGVVQDTLVVYSLSSMYVSNCCLATCDHIQHVDLKHLFLSFNLKRLFWPAKRKHERAFSRVYFKYSPYRKVIFVCPKIAGDLLTFGGKDTGIFVTSRWLKVWSTTNQDQGELNWCI